MAPELSSKQAGYNRGGRSFRAPREARVGPSGGPFTSRDVYCSAEQTGSAPERQDQTLRLSAVDVKIISDLNVAT